MRLTYQLLNFDYARGRAALEAFDARYGQGTSALDTVVVGDPSCVFRLSHIIGAPEPNRAWRDFSSHVRGKGRRLLVQLPITAKQSEVRELLDLADNLASTVDGFVCGDLGVLASLSGSDKALIHHGNIVNRSAADALLSVAKVECTRPLFLRERFLKADSHMPRDIVVYGPMLLSCSTFCVHCGDLPTACDFSCAAPKALKMEGELCDMVGRALYTERRLDLLSMLEEIPRVARATITDLHMPVDEWLWAAGHVVGAPPQATRPT